MTNARKRILTVPNLLSLLRLCMIPVFVILYLREHYIATAVTLVLSSLTDIADGWYARRFGAVSDLGKALDPIADKLTQFSMLLCLTRRHPTLLVPLLLLVVKELFAAVSGLVVIRATGRVPSAVWHGKVTTMLLYLLMFLHVVWKDIPLLLSNILTGICVVMMLISMTLYAIRNIRSIRAAKYGGT
ncbi:MAG: CDP-alcohol phosphatidyltransferase family protein [Aristaeellaceae bacterium]